MEFYCGHRGEQPSYHVPEGAVESLRLVCVVHLNMPAFNFDLARRMNRPVPRYTSYPTAPHFHAGFGEAAYAAELDRLRGAPARPLSLYFHVLFCAKLCFYCGCHMKVSRNSEVIDRYRAYLVREVDLVAERLGDARRVAQLHWGGGTPTSLGPHGIEQLMTHIRRRFDVDDGAEISLEADPRTLTEDHLRAARGVGFNRLSLGVQSFDETVQRAIGRLQPFEKVDRSVRWARALGFDGLSFDLIYGLPHQSPERFARTLELALSLKPDRMSVFGYAHVPWIKKHQQLIPADALPGPEERLHLFAQAFETLAASGYRHIGLDHFALADDSLCRAQDEGGLHRNFQGYSTHADCSLLGFGVSAIGSFDRAYAQNEKDLARYCAAIDSGRLPVARGTNLTDEDVLRREIITRLMCDFAVDKSILERRFGVVFDLHFADVLDEIADLQAAGVVEVGRDVIRVTEEGRPFVRNVAAVFDAYVKKSVSKADPVYSQAV